MKVSELMADLAQYHPDTEVLIAHQPSWPLAEVLDRVIADSERDVHDDDSDDDDEGDERDDVLWLVAGGSPTWRRPYAPRDVF